jgi:membrane-bound lytic murein transglycosylase F
MQPALSSPWWLFWLVLLPAVVFAKVVKHVDHEYWTDDFDHHFRKYSKHYFGAGFDWRWFKAQAIAESSLRPRVKSKAGAKGLMQILPSTFAEIKKKNPHFKSINSPKWNIAAGIYYDRQLYRRWSKDITRSERLPFVFGSYNAGFGNVRKAYRKALKKKNDINRWSEVERYTPKQTRHYVRRIHRLMKKDTG